MPEIRKPPVLIVQFAKWPEAGKVKTRLIPALGAEGALAAHITLTLFVLDQLAASGWPVEFWWDRPLEAPPEAAASILQRIRACGAVQKVQQGEDLGARMYQALDAGLKSFGKLLIVGSDCPSVDVSCLRQAVAALDHSDVVIGPSDDGGYVLLGASRVEKGMLAGIDWGTSRVLEQTVSRLQSLGLTHTRLAPGWDVDEAGDWQRFVELTGQTEAPPG